MVSISTRFTLPQTLETLARHTQATLRGDPLLELRGVATLKHATTQDISFLTNPLYASQLQSTEAGAVIVTPEAAIAYEGPALIHPNPHMVYARVAHLCIAAPKVQGDIHFSACIAKTAQVSPTANIGAGVVMGERSYIGERTVIHPNVVIGEDVVIGDDCEIYPQVTLYSAIQIGSRVKIHANAVVGSDGFGFAFNDNHWVTVPQLGSVQIHDDVDIGAHTTIDRGAIDDTIIEQGVKLDNHVQVAHNVIIGAHTVVAGTAAFSGSVKIGRYCVIGGGATFAGHITVCDRAQIAGMTTVTKSIDRPGTYASGTGMMPAQEWRKSVVHFRHLNDIVKRIKVLEHNLQESSEDE